MRKIIFAIFTWLFCISYYSQSRFVDSLRSIVTSEAPDSAKFIAGNLLATQFTTNNLDSAEKYTKLLLKIAERSRFKRAIARSYILLSEILGKKGNYAEQIRTIQNALVIMEEAKDTLGMMRVNIFIADAFLVSNDLDNAMLHAKKALEYYSRIGKEKMTTNAVFPRINNILGTINLRRNNPVKALAYFNIAYDNAITEKINDWTVAVILENLAAAYKLQGDLKNAKIYYQKALSLNKHLNSIAGMNTSFAGLASVYISENKTDSALQILEKAQKNALKMEDRTALLTIYDQFINIYNKLGNNERKAYYLELKLNLLSNLSSDTQGKALAAAKAKLRTYERERENAFLNAQNKVLQLEVQNTKNRIFMVIGVAVFILIVVLFRNKYNKLYSQKANMELEHRLLRSQMNPHFIFNSLSTIQSFVLAEDSLKAAKHLSVFSQLVRKTLDNSRREYILFNEEIETLKLYLELESIRMDRPFHFYMDFDSQVLSDLWVPPMLIQPHLENAIKHGIRVLPKGEEGLIHIQFEMKGKNLECIVEDNGIGILAAQSEKRSELHRSAGLEVTRSRLQLLCKVLKKEYYYKVTDKINLEEKGRGTIVEFNLPFKHDA